MLVDIGCEPPVFGSKPFLVSMKTWTTLVPLFTPCGVSTDTVRR